MLARFDADGGAANDGANDADASESLGQSPFCGGDGEVVVAMPEVTLVCPVCAGPLKRTAGKKFYDTVVCSANGKHFRGFVLRTAGGREVPVAENELPAVATVGARAKSLLDRAKRLAGEGANT